MKMKRFLVVPGILVVVSIITSILAFSYTSKLEKGYLYIKNHTLTITYDGEYFAILGNIADQEQTILASSKNDGIHITTYDNQDALINEYILNIHPLNESYNPSIVTSVISNSPVVIDDIDDYLFYVKLQKGTTYQATYTSSTVSNTDDMMDIVLVNLPEQYINLKDTTENVAFTSLVFAGIAGITIGAIMYIKKD